METLVRNLKLLWKSQGILAEIQVKVLTQKIVLSVFAGLAGLFGLGMLNLAVFFAIEQSLGPTMASLLVGLGNIVIAAGVLLVVQRLDGGREAQVVEDVRDLVLSDIEAEAVAVQNQIIEVRDEIAAMSNNIVRLVQNPLEALSPRLLIPATTALTKLVSASGSASPRPARRKARKTRSGASARTASKPAKSASKRTRAAPKRTRKSARG